MSNYRILLKMFNKYDLFAENSRLYFDMGGYGFFGRERSGAVSLAADVMRRAAK